MEMDQSFDQTVPSICDAKQVVLTPATPSLVAVGGRGASPEEGGPSVVSGQKRSDRAGQQTESTSSFVIPPRCVSSIAVFINMTCEAIFWC
ncbi:hypothetical protein MFIFM68171_03112 [Madurella fahalii]|uniref:Uncharacterized protein n=1 Tax=Madurella fahalii TaxID=1157608 RepID=A0ABQ0G575_9PEZI